MPRLRQPPNIFDIFTELFGILTHGPTQSHFAFSAMINKNRLFYGSCLALLTTAFAFTVINGIAFSVKQEFILTNAQLGVFTGVFFIGFTISQVIFSPLCDIIGMRWIVRGAFVGHVAGAILIMIAGQYEMAVAGSLFAGLGAGLVEAGCNPLVAALYPDNKSTKLNHFHMWFPYGNLIAAVVLTLIFANLGAGWRSYLLLILVPAIGYGIMMITAPYPHTEGRSAGVSVGQSFKALFAPIMLIMMPMMLLTASMELPPSAWVPPVLEAGGVNGLLVFGFIFGIMGTLRLLAGPVVRAFTPTGILFGGAVLTVIGLYLFSSASTLLMTFVTAAIWAVGIAYFWPTMLGFVSERNPKSGALGLGVMGAIGMLAAFFVTPWLGSVADEKGHATLDETATIAVLDSATTTFPALAESAGNQAQDIRDMIGQVQGVLDEANESGSLPSGSTMQALRAISQSGLESDVVGEAAGILNPADHAGGQQSFRTLVPFGLILVLVFGVLLVMDRRAGGYKAEKLGRSDDDDDEVARSHLMN